jgi:hypothetical protein
MKKITENALLFRVNQLNEKLAMYEAAQATQQPQGGIMQSMGNALGSAAGYATAVPRAIADAGQYAYNHAGGAVDAVKNAASNAANTVVQGAQNFGQGVAQGWNNTDPAKMAGIDVNAPQQQGTSGKPVAQQKQQAPAAKPAATTAQKQQAPAAKPDPAVVKIQQDLIAKGYPLKADGIMGPKTQQAMDWQAKSDKRDAGVQATNNMDPSKPAPAVPTDPAQKAAYDAAIKNMNPAQTPAPAPAGAAAITPAFQSQQAPAPAAPAQQSAYNSSALGQLQRSLQQQEAGQSIQTPPPEKPEGVTVFPGTATQQQTAESVSFKNEDSLARIVQLAKW